MATAAAVIACFAATAACAGRAPETVERPRTNDAPVRPRDSELPVAGPRPALIVDIMPAPPPTPATARPSRLRPPVPEYLLEPPEWFFDLETIADDVQLVDVRARTVAVPPRPPLVPTAPRVPVAGDAVALAETALARGDAFDAAAQLTSLLDVAPLDARPYLEVQLSRAYVVLDRLDEADAVLRKRLAVGGPSAWPAVFELATLHVVHRAGDPSDVLEWLAPYAVPLREDLARYLMQFTTSPVEIAQLRGIAVPPSTQPLIKSCADQLAAFETRRPHGLPGWRVCPVLTSSPTPIGHSATEREQLQRIVSEAKYWTTLFARPPDAERWLNRAHRLGDVVALDRSSTAAVLATWLALIAYQNATNTAVHRGEPFRVSRDFLVYAHAQIDRLHPQFRDRVRDLADNLFVP